MDSALGVRKDGLVPIVRTQPVVVRGVPTWPGIEDPVLWDPGGLVFQQLVIAVSGHAVVGEKFDRQIGRPVEALARQAVKVLESPRRGCRVLDTSGRVVRRPRTAQ